MLRSRIDSKPYPNPLAAEAQEMALAEIRRQVALPHEERIKTGRVREDSSYTASTLPKPEKPFEKRYVNPAAVIRGEKHV